MKVKIGDVVTPKTVAGLCLADVPVDGDQDQKRKTTCILRGKGTVIAINECVIDYDTWGSGDPDDPDNPDFSGIGKIDYINVLVKCDAGQGWCGSGALNEYA